MGNILNRINITLCFICISFLTFAQKTETAESIVAKMTPSEKFSQMYGIPNTITSHMINSMFVKAITGKGTMVKSGENKKYNIPAMVFVDGPKGVSYYGKHTAFPAPVTRGCSFDKDLEYKIGEALSLETQASGANYIGAVTLNMLYHPHAGQSELWYGEDPFLVGLMGVELTKGIQKDNRVMACAKHYALFELETNKGNINSVVGERALREIFLEPFRRVVQDADVASIMPAYNLVNGIYSGENKYLLTDIARNEWGFKGFYASDWGLCVYNGVNSIKAGCNIEMPNVNHYAKDTIMNAIKNNKLAWSDIDNLILPTIRTKMKYTANKAFDLDAETLKKHRALSQESAEKSMVLLKNNNNVLPLEVNEIKNVLVVGELAKYENMGQIFYNPEVSERDKITPLKGIRKYLKDSKVSVTFTDGKDKSVLYQLGKVADAIVVCVGRTTWDQSEKLLNPNTGEGVMGIKSGGDKKDLDLKQEEINIIGIVSRLGKKTTVVYYGGSAVTVSTWINRVPSVIFAGFPGMNGGDALANILFGKVTPSGKLSYSVFEKEIDYPTMPSEPEDVTTHKAYDEFVDPYDVQYGYYFGYTLADKKNIAVSYPFGYGLSYTKFKIDGVGTDKTTYMENDIIKVRCTIKNIGDMKGGEVVQVYAGFANAKIDRPVKALKNFAKVYLEANGSTEVELAIPVKDLAYWDANSKSWKVEKITYPIYVGNSSRFEDLQKVQVEVQ